MPSIVLFLLSSLSLGYAFFVQGLVAILIGFILFLLIRNKPKYVVKSSKSATSEKSDKFSSVIGMKNYVIFVFAVFLLGGICIVGVNFLSILFSTAGSSAEVAANVVVFSSISLCISKLINGVIYEKLGTFKGTVLFIVILFIGSIIVCIAPGQSDFLIYASVCIFIFGAPISTVGISR